jgi:hypothetical protein
MKLKHGTVREDGMIFWSMQRGKEYWVAKKTFEKRKSKYKNSKTDLKSAHGKRKRGEAREDGMVFWAYHYHCKDGEQWVTKDQYVLKTEAGRKAAAERYKKNPKRCKDITNKCHRKHRHKRRFAFKKWYYDNREEYLFRCSIKNKTPEARRRHCEYQKKRKMIDPLYRLRHSISTAISNALKRYGYRKKSRTAEILGCSMEEFKAHIESQFLDGMSWDNRSLWHIDHIMPVSMAKTEDELIRLNHYRNLRPMWAKDNLSKSDKTPDTLVLF